MVWLGFTYKCGFTTAVKHDINIIHNKEANMIRVVGQLGCSNCEITKQILKKKGVSFEYELLSSLSGEEQDTSAIICLPNPP
jgi:hypothetical protein